MTHERYRTRQWAAIRKTVLARDRYLCQIKQAHNCAGRATEVDHIVRPEDGGAEYDPVNLQAACKAGNVAKRNIDLANRAAGRTPTATDVGWSRDWTGQGTWTPNETGEQRRARNRIEHDRQRNNYP